MNLDQGVELLIQLAGLQMVNVPLGLAKLGRRDSVPRLPEVRPHGFTVYVGPAQGWKNSSVFLATVAQKSKFQALTNKLVKKRHWLSQEQVPDFLKQAWCEVETEVARLSEKVPELAHNEIYGAVYASWIPDQSSYSFICQALWSENGTDLSIWLDLGNADGWEFQLREYLFVTQGQVTSSAGLSVGDHMSNVWVNDIVEACQITANYAGQEFGKRNVVIEGKVMKEDNLVVLIDVYEGPENVNREPVTHHKHIELMNLPPRCQWSSP